MTWVQIVLIGLIGSVFIPMFVVIKYRPKLNTFFKFLFASILLSFVFDVIGLYGGLVYRYNMGTYCLYYMINALVITLLWTKVPDYSTRSKLFAVILGICVFLMMLFCLVFYDSFETAYLVISSLSVLLGLILALQYYNHKMRAISYTPIMQDPYFLTASGFIFFCFSSLIIINAQPLLKGTNALKIIWPFRQIFYLLFNIIIAYSFYVLYRIQSTSK